MLVALRIASTIVTIVYGSSPLPPDPWNLYGSRMAYCDRTPGAALLPADSLCLVPPPAAVRRHHRQKWRDTHAHATTVTTPQSTTFCTDPRDTGVQS